MKLFSIRSIFILLFAVLLWGCGNEFEGVQKLVERRVPWLADDVEFYKIDSPQGSAFVIKPGKKVMIGATDPNTAAVGLNWYLKYYCNRSMSHMGDNLSPVAELPMPEKEIRIETESDYRYALNYCTYNYTMSFYNWDDWERELDWMALNGVNMMLVANGSEAVWQNTLRRLGYGEEEIFDFITGPAYNAWWLMGNVEGWGGPMPQSQIDSRRQTVTKMLSRMKELGIEPLMPGFYGMVPSNYKERSDAHVVTQGAWGAFTRPDILDPTDPDFERVADIFYEETKKIYGGDLRFFSGDPFHEGGQTAGVDLGEAGKAVQASMQKHFPGSVWVLQGWQDNPKPGILEKLDRKHVLVQELFGENTANWEVRGGYEGTPFIWATVTNFGERPGLNGKLQRFADEVHRAATGPYGYSAADGTGLKGVGIIPEGINNNPVVYDLVCELPWHRDRVDVGEWIRGYSAYRYGKPDPDLEQAWRIFAETVYSSDVGYQEGPPENVLCARPGLDAISVSTWGRIEKKYDTELYRKGVEYFTQALPRFRDSDTYVIDLINFLRQVIAIDADEVYSRLVRAVRAKDRASFEMEAERFLALIDAENELLAQHPWYRLSTYQQQALDSGNTPEEKDNNLHNAMMLISYWGENVVSEDYLHDYAYKEWAGLMSSYYKERWLIYFDYLRKTMNGQKAEAPDFFWWERNWAESNRKLVKDAPTVSLEEAVEYVNL